MRIRTLLLVLAICGVVLAQRPDYEGPTILSRGVGPVLQGGGTEFVRIRPYLSVQGIYDNELTPVSVDQNGNIPQANLFGVEGGFGLLGYHNWRRSILGLDYRGNYRHYNKDTYYNGSDHLLSLGFTHQMSRRTTFTLRQGAGMYSRSYAPLTAGGFYASNFTDAPMNDLFDAPTYYFNTLADLTFAKSPRLSFNFGGSGVMTRHRSRQLVGVTGGSARGDVAYLLNQSNAIGFDYGFNHYGFTNAFGSSDVHSLAFDYSVKFARNWHFGLRAGASRVESLGLRRVAIDPIVAAIIGSGTGVEAFYRVNYVPHGDVNLSRSFRRSSVSIGYTMGTSYGNGVYLTSRVQNAYSNFSYTATRKWNVGFSGSYDTYSSLSQQIGKYQGYTGGAGVTYQITSVLHLIMRFDARRYDVADADFKRLSYRGSVGFAFSPGDMPLSLW